MSAAKINPWMARIERTRGAVQAREFVIVNTLETDGPLTIRGLGAKTGMDHTTLGFHLNALLKAKVIARKRIARTSRAKQPAFEWRIS